MLLKTGLWQPLLCCRLSSLEPGLSVGKKFKATALCDKSRGGIMADVDARHASCSNEGEDGQGFGGPDSLLNGPGGNPASGDTTALSRPISSLLAPEPEQLSRCLSRCALPQ